MDELLPEYVLGTLSDEARSVVEAHLGVCARCLAEERATAEALALFGFAAEPVAASPEARMRLVAATRPVQPLKRFDFVARMATFFDIGVGQARALIEKASNPAAWEPGPTPGLYLLHLRPGPAFAGADAGLVRFDGGARFPLHTHTGAEHTLMLEGGLVLDDGARLVPGDYLLKQPGSRHSFQVFDEGCLYALVLYDGVEIEGVGKLTARQ